MNVSISIETPLQEDVEILVRELNEFTFTLTPAGYCHHLTPQDMATPQTSLFVARETGKAMGCGALHRHGQKVAEVKRMFVRPAARRSGIGRMILDRVVSLAVDENFEEIVLETGNNFDRAIELYERAGFEKCGPVLDYEDSPFTAFYRKPLHEGAKT